QDRIDVRDGRSGRERLAAGLAALEQDGGLGEAVAHFPRGVQLLVPLAARGAEVTHGGGGGAQPGSDGGSEDRKAGDRGDLVAPLERDLGFLEATLTHVFVAENEVAGDHARRGAGLLGPGRATLRQPPAT